MMTSCNKTVKEKTKKIKGVNEVEEVDICYCCRGEYPRGNGYFRYREAGEWYTFEQKQDLLRVAVGKYCCSPKCAMDCAIPPPPRRY